MEKYTQKLPQDVAQLHEIIISLQNKYAELASSHQEKIDEIADLRFKLQKALMARFGRRTEKFSDQQLNLFDEPKPPAEDVVEEIQQADEEITVASFTRKRSGRRPLPAELPREQIIHDLRDEEKVCTCGHALHP